MLSLFQLFLVLLAVLAVMIGILTLGLALSPRPFRPHPAPTHLEEGQAFQPDLPEIVRRHFERTIGEIPPVIRSAVVWGRGTAHLGGVWVPLRFRAWYRPGEAFSRRVEFTFFQRPVMRAGDRLIKGQGFYEMGDRAESGDGVDQSERMALWAETVWMPCVFVHDPKIRWVAEDEHSARLVFPTLAGEDHLAVHFDPLSGVMTHLAGRRYSPETGEFEPWRFDLQQWKKFHGLLIPCEVAVAWGEAGSPWSYWRVDGVAYNVNVSDQLGEPQEDFVQEH